jgi:hypothetical protein
VERRTLPQLLTHADTYTVGALLLLVLCKGLAYTASLSSFRGGPTFPAMFIGAPTWIRTTRRTPVPGVRELTFLCG